MHVHPADPFQQRGTPGGGGLRFRASQESLARVTSVSFATVLGVSKVTCVEGRRHRRMIVRSLADCVVDLSKPGPARIIRELSEGQCLDVRRRALGEIVFDAVRRSERAALRWEARARYRDVSVGQWLDQDLLGQIEALAARPFGRPFGVDELAAHWLALTHGLHRSAGGLARSDAGHVVV